MIRPRILALGIVSLFALAAPTMGQAPTHVCPQYSWGQTGNIFHWYSEYIEVDGMNCTSLSWDNYDGSETEPNGGTCGQLGGCKALTEFLSTVIARVSAEVAARGLDELPDPATQPELDRTAIIIDTKFVDVMITDAKVIRVKLFLILVDPRLDGRLLKPILMGTGFEVQYNPALPAYTVIPNSDVSGSGNHYRIKFGAVTYNVNTHNEG